MRGRTSSTIMLQNLWQDFWSVDFAKSSAAYVRAQPATGSEPRSSQNYVLNGVILKIMKQENNRCEFESAKKN